MPSSHTPSPIKLISQKRPMSRKSSAMLNEKLTSSPGKGQAPTVQDEDTAGVITTPEPHAPVRPKRHLVPG